MDKMQASEGINQDRRRLLAAVTTGVVVVGAAILLPSPLSAAASNDAIHPFQIHVPEKELVDLRERLAATRWPDKETVTDQSQGAQLAKLRGLIQYWGTDYDWRKVEAKLNAPAAVHH